MHRDETLLAVGIAEAARRLGLSTRTVANLIASQQLPSRKVGRRRIVPLAALETFVNREHANQFLFCRVCRKAFPKHEKDVYERIVSHIEAKHPTEALSYMQETALLQEQEQDQQ